MDSTEIEKQLIDYINVHNGISSSLGELKFTASDRIGQGGNGIVYLATINEKEIAIKFLVSNFEGMIFQVVMLDIMVKYIKFRN